MATSGGSRCWKLGILSFLAVGGAIAVSGDRAFAQITPDGTLGAESSVVKPNVTINGLPSDQLDGGATRGANLFHSFKEFNIDTERGAYFTNPTGIKNILSRVTGNDPSDILGTLGVLGNANLFLINPNGIIFGPNASLDVGGSFLASTASSLKFADGSEFNTTSPQAPPLLKVSMPIGLQIETNLGSIMVQGLGHNLSYSDTGSTIRTDSLGLQVEPSETLALVGGDVVLVGGNLRAESGRIELGSVAQPSLVSLIQKDSGFALGYSDVQNFGDIQLSRKASADVSGEGGGEIQVQGRRVSVRDGSAILSITQSSRSGGSFTVNALESVELLGESADGQYVSSLSTEAQGTGSVGDLRIATGKLITTDGAYIQNYTFAEGNGGNLTVQASGSVELIGAGLFGSGLYAGATSTGNAGDLSIETRQMSIRDGGFVTTDNFGEGHGGNLTIGTGSLFVTNGGQISANTFGQGDAGDLTIETRSLSVDSSRISSSTFSKRNAGNLTVHASDSVVLSGEIPGEGGEDGFPGGLFAQVDLKGEGRGGNLTIETGRLSVSNGSKVQAATFGQGDAGELLIRASEVDVFNTLKPRFFTGIFAGIQQDPRSQTLPKGDGGKLTIETERLSIRDAGRVEANTLGEGEAGDLFIQARDLVEVVGTNENNSPSFLGAEVGSRDVSTPVSPEAITGKGGNLTINTRQLSIRDGGKVSVSTLARGDAGDILVQATDLIEVIGTSSDGQLSSELSAAVESTATGNGGDLTINTRQLTIKDKAEVSASTASSGRGETLTVTAPEAVTLSRGSLSTRASGSGDTVSGPLGQAGNLTVIADSVLLDRGSLTAVTGKGQGEGGANITLQVQGLLLMGNESQISADALDTANGGNINIDNNFLIALPPQGSNGSDIAANAFQGNGGRLEITAQGIFGIEFRPSETPLNDITASSKLGAAGVVTLNTPDVDLSRGLVTLPTDLVDASGLIAQSCPGGGGATASDQSEFIVTGRGGLPPNPGDTLSSEAALADWATLDTKVDNRSGAQETATKPTRENAPTQIVEAQGWTIGPKGEVILIASAPTVTPHIAWLPSASCHN